MRFLMFMLPCNQGQTDPSFPDTPTPEAAAIMGKYNDELVKAGVMLDGTGLHPQHEGVRVSFSGGKRTVTDGPFTEAKEAIGGFWVIEVKSKEEAVEWAKRVPAIDDGDFTIEVRQYYEQEEFDADVQAAVQQS